MQKINLFPSQIYKTKIDPNSYNKQELIDDVTYNYNLEPSRNYWDNLNCDLHHYYNDWNNPKFKTIDTSSILVQYDKIISNFMRGYNFSKNVKYSVRFENITAYKTNQNMDEHDHLAMKTNLKSIGIFSCIHYINYKDSHKPTTFINPLLASAYSIVLADMREVVNNKSNEMSTYFHMWQLDTEEDDFIIFPAYLKHKVEKTQPTDDLRISSVLNIYLEKE